METQTLQHLLSQVSAISKKYEEIAKITGENFNVFKILKLERSEKRTHSAFLAELLNPKGRHNQKDVFLKLFISQINSTLLKDEQIKINFDTTNTTVKPNEFESEEFAGWMNEDKTKGGYIDIMIRDKQNHCIIIENKIDASDQENQLIRYHNHDTNAYLFYLTLDGHPPSEWSTKSEKQELNQDKIILLSYKKHILEWLKLCRKEAVNHSLLRETITQYINLIKSLTGQTINNNMEKDIVDIIIESGKNISASIEISISVNEAKKRLLLNFAKKLEAKVKELDTEIEIEILPDFGNKFKGIYFKLPDLKREYIMLSFLLDMKYFYFEIVNEGNNKDVNNHNDENIIFYNKKLGEITANWGKSENVKGARHGDWFCQYHKLDALFEEPKIWTDLVENKTAIIINEVSQDVKVLIDVLRQKSQSKNS